MKTEELQQLIKQLDLTEEEVRLILLGSHKTIYIKNATGGITMTLGSYDSYGGTCRTKCIVSNNRELPLNEYDITWTTEKSHFDQLMPITDDYKGRRRFIIDDTCETR